MDLISRQDAIDAIKRKAYRHTYLDQIIDIINQMPSAQRKGKWKTAYLDHEAMGERPRILYCSECNQCIAYPTNFCPTCGADMRKGEQE